MKGDNSEIILRGIGLGGWLVPEGYMLQTASFANSPTEIHNTIEALIGTANTDQFFTLYRKNYVGRADIDSIARWGFNSIRLPMHYALFTPRDQPGVYLQEGFAIVDSLLSWCESNKLYLILDLHCAPGGQNNGNISDYNPAYPSLWEDPQNRTRTVDLWKKLAERFATSEWIGGYDLLNETAWNLGSGNTPLRTLFVDITNAIRSVDQNHIIYIEGNWYATDFNGLTPPWDSNMVYSFHKYWNTNDQNSIASYLSIRDSYNVPLWLGESGENSNMWFTECIALMEANAIGWAWWPHKKLESTAGPLAALKSADYDYLLWYWNGEAAKPTVDFAVNALTSMANNLRIDRCVFHRDVIDALFRQPFTDARLPFAGNLIPGLIYAVNYDLGKNLVAYRDIGYQNTGSGGWNNGGKYRNDGVDIEACADFPSNGYNVGWIESGEYLMYTVQVNQSGTYNLSLRAAGNAAGGMVQLRWDLLPLTPFVSIPATGGWQQWQSIELGQYALTAGTHTLGLFLYVGGFNVNLLDFALLSAGVTNEDNHAQSFALLQNHPNPFNPATTITYTLPPGAAQRVVSLTVYDLLGREVATLVEGPQAPGMHNVLFDGSGLASGVYLYRLSVPGEGYVQNRSMVLVR
jgi:endoglucanase